LGINRLSFCPFFVPLGMAFSKSKHFLTNIEDAHVPKVPKSCRFIIERPLQRLNVCRLARTGRMPHQLLGSCPTRHQQGKAFVSQFAIQRIPTLPCIHYWTLSALQDPVLGFHPSHFCPRGIPIASISGYFRRHQAIIWKQLKPLHCKLVWTMKPHYQRLLPSMHPLFRIQTRPLNICRLSIVLFADISSILSSRCGRQMFLLTGELQIS